MDGELTLEGDSMPNSWFVRRGKSVHYSKSHVTDFHEILFKQQAQGFVLKCLNLRAQKALDRLADYSARSTV